MLSSADLVRTHPREPRHSRWQAAKIANKDDGCSQCPNDMGVHQGVQESRDPL